VDGTPAADAGLQGGDVIVRVGSDSVASIGDLRLAVSLARGSIPIQLVRKGKTMQVVISRR
jgi:S1-C subfamily serine protease